MVPALVGCGLEGIGYCRDIPKPQETGLSWERGRWRRYGIRKGTSENMVESEYRRHSKDLFSTCWRLLEIVVS